MIRYPSFLQGNPNICISGYILPSDNPSHMVTLAVAKQFCLSHLRGKHGFREVVAQTLDEINEETRRIYKEVGADITTINRLDPLSKKHLLEARDALLPYAKVEKFLGHGGFGFVFKIKRHIDKQVFAAKVLLKVDKNDTRQTNLFRNEVNVMKMLERKSNYHVQICDNIENDQAVIIIMEYCQKGSLDQHFHQSVPRVDIREIRVLFQVLSGIRDLHEVGVAHRDIKPANIFVGDYDIAKIGDFGLATHTLSTDYFFRGVVGTAHYMAPEVAANQKFIPLKADVWSAGATFYSMLTGKVPFSDALWSRRLGVITRDDVCSLLQPLRQKPISIGCLYILQSLLEVNADERISISEAISLCAREMNYFWMLYSEK